MRSNKNRPRPVSYSVSIRVKLARSTLHRILPGLSPQEPRRGVLAAGSPRRWASGWAACRGRPKAAQRRAWARFDRSLDKKKEDGPRPRSVGVASPEALRGACRRVRGKERLGQPTRSEAQGAAERATARCARPRASTRGEPRPGRGARTAARHRQVASKLNYPKPCALPGPGCIRPPLHWLDKTAIGLDKTAIGFDIEASFDKMAIGAGLQLKLASLCPGRTCFFREAHFCPGRPRRP